MYVARQPIVDREGRVAAYELLFRSPGKPLDDGVFATASVANAAFAGADFADIVGPHRAFVNVDAAFLAGQMIESLPPARAVVELLETIEFTPALVARCRDLKERGYTLACDDYRGDRAAIEPVLDLVEIIKVDLPAVSGIEMTRIARAFPGKTMLAEKVETERQWKSCRNAGYALFQGYFFAKPETAANARPDGDVASVLTVLGLVAREAPDMAVDEALKKAPKLGVGLLRLVNSAASGLSQPVSSIRQALYRVGRRQLRGWLMLLAYVGQHPDAQQAPLLQLAAVRAKTMELLAARAGADPEAAFLTGLVSLLNVSLGLPREQVIERLAIDPEIVSALTGYAGVLGRLLRIAEAMERADDAAVAELLAGLRGITSDDLLPVSQSALRWACALGAEEPKRAAA